MFKEQMNKLKSIILKKPEEKEKTNKPNKTNKRKIENLVVFLIILIITIIAINAILGGEPKENKKEDSSYKVLADVQKAGKEEKEDELEKRLENILETMVGVRRSKSTNHIHPVKWSSRNV